MRLQQRTDYALRVLMFLAHSEGATAATIANAHGISASHLSKVMQVLSAANFIHAQKGRGKLTTLARHPSDITVGEVVRAFETMELAECARADSPCLLVNRCTLQKALSRAAESFLATLDATTLADLQSPSTEKLVRLARTR